MSEVRKPSILSKETLVPIGLVLTIVGASMFISSIATRVDANERNIEKIQDKIDTLATKNDLIEATKNIKEFINK